MNNIKRFLSVLLSICLSCSFISGTVSAAEEEEKTGKFTAVSMNVDGLPNKILGISINGDGPGASGTTAISAKMLEYGWDIIGVSEDFNYNTELMSSLTQYSSGTHRGGVSRLKNDTDGLNLIWKNTLSVTGEKWTSWNTSYSTGIFNTGNGADGMIDKGYRYYQVMIAEDVAVDVYILHMDADSDAGDIAARESQLTQLANAIKASDNGNPIIVMGDTNCRYTRENLKTLFVDAINADSRFTVQDTWIEKVRGGEYPVYGSDALVAKDKGGTYDYPDAEIVDKVFYINNTDSNVTLEADSYTIALDFTDDAGNALADHWPVVVNFQYSVASAHTHSYTSAITKKATCTDKGIKTYSCSCGDSYTEDIDALGHDYHSVTTQANCTEDGIITYTCSRCNDSYTEDIVALGHDYVDGICSRCNAKDPNAEITDPSEPDQDTSMTLGNPTLEITSGNSYALVFQSSVGSYTLAHDDNTLSSISFKKETGDEVDENLVWTVSETDGGYTISTESNGQIMYLARTKSFVGYGYKIALQNDPFVWNMSVDTTKGSIRFYTQIVKSNYYLRYYNARMG